MALRTFLHASTWLAAAVAVVGAHAQEDYRCKIDRVHNAEGDGPKSLVHMARKSLIGKEFSVSRESGAMSGPLRNNHRSKPVVIDTGSTENSFKVVSTLNPNEIGPGSAVFALVVNEYVDGARKPFVFLSSDTVYFGTCQHDR